MHQDVQHALDALCAATAGLDAGGLAWHPPGRWSAAQILDHLRKAYGGTTHVLGRCLESGQTKARPVTLRDRLYTLVVVRLGHLPGGRTAPEVTRPSETPDPNIVTLAEAALLAFGEAADRAEARFGPTARLMNHPILGPLTAPQWRRFHLVHTRHHMKQIARRRSGV